ncbi:MAG: hypothetical protein JO288_09280, partial [Hyphomicrobiales bacterium]|nr:hypothetical protein [Hyphomicrobiales bacterium]
MRRARALAILVVIATGLGALGFVSWPIPRPIVAEKLEARSGALPRLRLDAAGAATFRAFPWPSVSITEARLELNGGAIVVTAPEARMDLAIVDLVGGGLAPVRASFTSPIVTWDVDRLADAGPSGLLDAAASAFAPLEGVSLIDGVLRVASRKHAFDVVIDNLSGRVAGLARGGRLRVDLLATWRDAPFAVSGLIAQPELGARGKTSAMN